MTAAPGAGGRPAARAVERLEDWVALQAASRPEAVAVVMGGETLSYGGLEARSNRLARLLRRTGCGRGDRVALLAPKSPAAVAAVVAVYKAGAALVPLDPASPAPRLAKILRSSDCGWLLAGEGTAPRLAELGDALRGARAPRVGWLGAAGPAAGGFSFESAFTAAGLAAVSPAPLEPGGDALDPAHLLFTSGSTGEPKGVVIPHAPVVRFVRWAVRHFRIEPGERLSGHPPLHFDLAYLDLFGAFAAGAELHLIPAEANLLPHRLAELVRRSRLTQLFAVPSALAYMARFDAVRQDDFPALRRLLWCGEVFPTPDLVHWMTRLPHVAFANLYGPTETTIASSYYDLPAPPDHLGAAIPIGSRRACDGEALRVLDPELRPAQMGEPGDLYVAGAGLSPGYWRDPARTAAAFLPAPSSGEAQPAPGARIYKTGDLARTGRGGEVFFLGRADTQIKSRGHRIELGEIENALAAVGAVREAVVTAIASDGFEGQLICCAYVPAVAGPGRPAPGPAELRRELARRLPAYMLPARWLEWDRLPRNANGKIDRTRVAEAARRQEIERHAALAATGS